jgi:hypothetical protein
MCLERISEKMVADRDITVYKRLVMKPVINPKLNNKPFSCKISNVLVEGKLSVEREQLFFCTNDIRFSGEEADDKKGFKYSWVLDHQVDLKTLRVEGKKMKTVSEEFLATPYQGTPITLGKEYESEISFITENGRDAIMKALHSFKSQRNARGDGSGFVVKCIIPKGTEYWEGWFYGIPSIASRKLIYGTELKKIGE